MNIEKRHERAKLIFAFILINFTLAVICNVFLFINSNGGSEFLRCKIHDVFHLYCPACGATRSAVSLLHFDFISALKYNAVLPLASVTVLYYEVCALVAAIRADVGILLNKKGWLWVIFALALCLYFVIRNVLLIFFRIDITGDFIP